MTTQQSTHLADTDQQRATQAAQALADDYKRVADEQRARADGLASERRALCDLLSADSTTVAGQTLTEAVRAIQAERDGLARDYAALVASHSATQAAQALADDYKRVADRQRKEIEERVPRREYNLLLSGYKEAVSDAAAAQAKLGIAERMARYLGWAFEQKLIRPNETAELLGQVLREWEAGVSDADSL